MLARQAGLRLSLRCPLRKIPAARPLFSSAPRSGPSAQSQVPPSTTSGSTAAPAETRAPRLPSKLERYAPRLAQLSARTRVPLPSLVISFLVLHELTAVAPLLALFWVFNALGAGAGFIAWLFGEPVVVPVDVPAPEDRGSREGHEGDVGLVKAWYDEGVARVERVGRRYGLLGYEKGSKPGDGSRPPAGGVADAIAAYVVVKALLPLRIGVSIAAAPGFARFVLRPFRRWMKTG